jgi:acetolactate synthase I/II/III large subunit
VEASLAADASEWSYKEVAERANSMRDGLREGTAGVPAWRVVEITQDVVGDARVTVDAGAHMFAATWFWRSDRPNRFHISNGLATMGYAIPAAFGAALAAPSDRVVAFTGDGGFTMNAAELETAARVGAKAIIVVLNDASLSLIRVKESETGGGRSTVDFLRTDFAQVARAFGAYGLSASSEHELRGALEEAVKAQVTSVVDVQIDGSDYGAMYRRIRGG